MAFADGFVGPQLRQCIDASRALTAQLYSPDLDEDESGISLIPLANQALAGLVRLLEADLGIKVRFIADPSQPALAMPGEQPCGAGIGAPVRLASGHILGMLSFFHREPAGQLDERDVRRLDMAARLAARLIDGADAHGIAS
ncbi:MAG: hypothetical protein JSS14_06310 [Proteobacteria bacterium]|nr:hypothetical protein [Pseudomonadota bacterium]